MDKWEKKHYRKGLDSQKIVLMLSLVCIFQLRDLIYQMVMHRKYVALVPTAQNDHNEEHGRVRTIKVETPSPLWHDI